MNGSQILGAVLVVVGVVALFFGLQGSNSAVDQLSETFTGRFTDETMWYLIGGIAAIIAGILLFLFGRRASRLG